MTAIRALALPALIDLPRDEAAHDGLPWEIWWVSAKLSAGDLNLGVHVMFNHLSGGALYVGTTITDLETENELTSVVLLQLGDWSSSKDNLRIESPHCKFMGTFSEGYRLTATLAEGSGFDLDFKPTRPILHNGGSGQYNFMGVTTTQYSNGALETTGKLRLHGEEHAVVGNAWYDRQWDHWVRTNQLAFTWFGICLPNGDNLSMFDMRDTRGEGDQWVTIVRPDGTHIITAAGLTVLAPGTSQRGRPVPRRWMLEIPAMNARFNVHQRMITDGEAIYNCALDVGGVYEGSEMQAYGFCDVTGLVK